MTDEAIVRQAINALEDIFYVSDTEGEVVFVNDAAVETTGHSKAEIETNDALDYFPPDERDRVASAMETALETGRADIETDVITDDDGVVPFEFRKRRVTDPEGAVSGLTGIGRDITRRKERERELERQNQRLTELAGTLSHDLRNPMEVARGRIELAQEDGDPAHLASAARAIDRMDELIQDVLTIVREGPGVEALEPVDVDRLAATAWQNVESGEADLVATSDRVIEADPSRLQQILENLFRNAIQHGGPDVTVSVGGLEDGFFVEDDGAGMSEEARRRAFELGYSTGANGIGLGLTIVERLVEDHGWAISVEASPTGGSRFSITDVDVERS